MLSRLSPYWLWVLLSVPALGMTSVFLGDDARAFHGLLHPTGEFAARFMIIAMLVTPLMYLTKGASWARWLKTNRRYFGVAAFSYAALHTYVYLVDKADIGRILTEAVRFDIATGWVAMLIFIPLAATSMDPAVRALGRWWKPLQRLTYAAAVLTLLHWASLHDWNGWAPALVHFTPLAVLSLYRLWWLYLRPRPGAMA
ncbi:MAG: sulfite oxidase heme-binding subunit YedZ [Paracoccaceae bacterium]